MRNKFTDTRIVQPREFIEYGKDSGGYYHVRGGGWAFYSAAHHHPVGW